MLNQNVSRRLSTNMMVKVGLLSAITIVLGLSGLGFIPIQPFKLTIMHLPVIIGSILLGPLAGALVGLFFGLFSIYQNIVNPTVVSFAFYNPLVSVLPRILIGIVPYYVYKFFSKFNETSGIAIGVALGSLTNTVGVLSMIYIIYLEKYISAKDVTGKAFLGAGALNGILEAGLATLIVVPIVLSINKIVKSKEYMKWRPRRVSILFSHI